MQAPWGHSGFYPRPVVGMGAKEMEEEYRLLMLTLELEVGKDVTKVWSFLCIWAGLIESCAGPPGGDDNQTSEFGLQAEG